MLRLSGAGDNSVPEDLLAELRAAAESSKSSLGDERADMRIADSCMIAQRGKKLALAEVHLRPRRDRTSTVVIVLDTTVPKDARKRIGTLRFDGEGLPCDLGQLLDCHMLPALSYCEGKVSFIDGCAKPIPRTELPGVAELHRLSGHQWEEEMEDRALYLWDVYGQPGLENFAGAAPPGEKRQLEPIREPTRRRRPAVHDTECDVLQTLLSEQQNPNSRLSMLPAELVYVIYDTVAAWMAWDLHLDRNGIFASVVARVEFPPPTGLNCNMMPIRIGNPDLIPENMRQYLPLLAACPISPYEYDRIGYLTIHESEIEENWTSQRRGGIHTDNPGRIFGPDQTQLSVKESNNGGDWMMHNSSYTIAWGRGRLYDDGLGTHFYYKGGLYMASNVANSCRIWNCKVADPAKTVGPLGDLEHMRTALGAGAALDAGEVAWITDCTPHESLPLPIGTKRQYFRLVTSDVTVWYADHSTKNPLGVKPPDTVLIVKGNKFENREEARTQVPPN